MYNSERPRVNLRNGFSDRNNIKPINKTIQYKMLDYRTRVKILDLVKTMIDTAMRDKTDDHKYLFVRLVYRDIYSMPHQIIGSTYSEIFDLKNIIGETIMKDSYDDIFSLIEGLCNIISSCFYINIRLFHDTFNNVFKDEFVGYRFVNGIIVEIIDENEMRAIEEAVNLSEDVIGNHFNKALVLLSDRENPDYANSIKESISAVEAMCSIITGEQGSLGKLLNFLESKKINIHPSLKEAFKKLYGYTCDANGIRHAGNVDGPGATFEESKFMLVVCCAFVNYLKDLQTNV